MNNTARISQSQTDDRPEARLTLVQSQYGDMVKVEFDRHIGHYRNLGFALTDVEFFNHRPVYDDWRLEAESKAREIADGPDWYRE